MHTHQRVRCEQSDISEENGLGGCGGVIIFPFGSLRARTAAGRIRHRADFFLCIRVTGFRREEEKTNKQSKCSDRNTHTHIVYVYELRVYFVC